MELKAVFLFTFANDAYYKLSLDEEWRAVEVALRSKENDLIFNLTPNAKSTDIFDKFNYYHNRIVVFHYGGHSDGKNLHLVDNKLNEKDLAVLLGQEKQLRLVFLNGCYSKTQVQRLFDKGVPAVIAASKAIDDHKSALLSSQFYTALASGKTILQAFEAAAAFVNNQSKKIEVKHRGLVTNRDNDILEWGLYVLDEKENILNWKISSGVSLLKGADDISITTSKSIRKKINLFIITVVFVSFFYEFGGNTVVFSNQPISQNDYINQQVEQNDQQEENTLIQNSNNSKKEKVNSFPNTSSIGMEEKSLPIKVSGLLKGNFESISHKKYEAVFLFNQGGRLQSEINTKGEFQFNCYKSNCETVKVGTLQILYDGKVILSRTQQLGQVNNIPYRIE